MMTAVVGKRSRICEASHTPSRPGMLTSQTAMSIGFSESSVSAASAQSASVAQYPKRLTQAASMGRSEMSSSTTSTEGMSDASRAGTSFDGKNDEGFNQRQKRISMS